MARHHDPADFYPQQGAKYYVKDLGSGSCPLLYSRALKTGCKISKKLFQQRLTRGITDLEELIKPKVHSRKSKPKVIDTSELDARKAALASVQECDSDE